MKNLILFAFAAFLFQACAPNPSILALGPDQSMSVTGKGAGQDAAYNPWSGEGSIAIVENKGPNDFVVRIQKAGELIENITVQPHETREINLQKGFEMYLDSDAKSKAKVNFRKFEG